MQTRREMLPFAAPPWPACWPPPGCCPPPPRRPGTKAAFDAKTMADLVKALGGGAPAESKDVTITGPDIAENGAVVPVGCVATTPAGRQAPAAAGREEPQRCWPRCSTSPMRVDANFSTRVKMGQSSNVYAVAMMADGKVLFAQKEIKVTLGGCGG
jgi:sulfur-oxidizing protein SoxY